MSLKYLGGFITKNAPTLNPALGSAAPGIWTLDQVTQAIRNNTWPAYDPNFENVTLLLHGNGTNGAQNNTFLDGSTNNFTITRNGNTTQGTFSPYGNNWSNYFDGTGDGLNAGSQPAYAFGTGPFCIEFWVYNTALKNYSCGVTTRPDNGSYSDAYHIGWDSVGGVSLYVGTTSSPTGPSGTMKVGQWQHFVCCRDSSNNTSIFVDGSRTGTAVITANFTRQLLGVGDFPTTPAEGVQGYLSNVRLVKGSSVYDPTLTTLTVPAAPLTAITNTSLLTCQSNRFIDNSANAFAITLNGTPSVQRFSPFPPSAEYSASTIGGSAYFDGTGDSIDLANNSILTPSGDFTIELWAYVTNSSGSQEWYSKGYGIQIYITTAKWGIALSANNTNSYFLNDTTASVVINCWTHLAVTRSGNTYRWFVNGVLITSVTFSSPPSTGTSVVRMGDWSDGSGFNAKGFIAGVRYINGSAQYTGAFTPPTSPPTAVTNTSLLINFTNAGIIDNAMMNNLETIGNAQISTTQSKFGGSSMYFDGIGDYLVSNAASTDLYAFGTGDFTIEMWIRFNAINSVQLVYDSRPTSQGNYPMIYLNSDGTIRYYVNSVDRITSSAISSGVWYHLAIARSGTSTKMFIDGTQAGSTYTDSTSYLNASGRPWIGFNAFNSNPDQALNAYVDELRVTKGVARYTANFTPQTSQWQDQ